MSVGLPGVGIGGLFFILSGLLLPFVELPRTLVRRSSLARWRVVLRQSGIAWGIVVAFDRMLWLLGLGLERMDEAETSAIAHAQTSEFSLHLPVTPLLAALAVLTLVLAGAALVSLVARTRTPA